MMGFDDEYHQFQGKPHDFFDFIYGYEIKIIRYQYKNFEKYIKVPALQSYINLYIID